MSELIDREQAKDAIDKYLVGRNLVTDGTMMARLINEIVIDRLPSAQPEPLTDKEQRIFLAAMERERKVCKEVDDQYIHEPYEVLLTKVCDEIKRKVKKVLWT